MLGLALACFFSAFGAAATPAVFDFIEHAKKVQDRSEKK